MRSGCYAAQVAISNVDDLLARIRSLPLEERLRLIERAAHEAVEDTPKPSNVVESRAPSMLGLMADEPDLVDEICALAYQARTLARMRSFDD
jgi:hypothetical protein